jgi:hypothetical protein
MERTQRPVVHPLPGHKIAKGEVLDQLPLDLPGAGDAQRIRVKPYAQHQLQRIQQPAFGAVALFKHTHIQSLNHSTNEETKVFRAQLVPHARRQQIRLIRPVAPKSRHTVLSPNSAVDYKCLV